MKSTWIILAFAVFAAASAGCEKKTEAPQVEKAEMPAQPALVHQPAKTMDFTMAQRTPEQVTEQAAASPFADFFIKKVDSGLDAWEKSGAWFDRVIEVGGKQLDLRGITIRKFEMSAVSLMTIYAVAFYIDGREKVEDETNDVEKVLILEYRIDVPKEKVVEAIKENVRSNPKVDIALVEPMFNKLSDAFDSPKKGDRYEFVYLPGRGTAMIKAGRVLTMIESREFAEAFFAIWLSPHGKDVEMRCELLALPCPKPNLNPVNALSSGIDGTKEKLGRLKDLVS